MGVALLTYPVLMASDILLYQVKWDIPCWLELDIQYNLKWELILRSLRPSSLGWVQYWYFNPSGTLQQSQIELMCITYNVTVTNKHDDDGNAVWFCTCWWGSETASRTDSGTGWTSQFSIWGKEVEEKGRVGRLCFHQYLRVQVIIISSLIPNTYGLYSVCRKGGALFKVIISLVECFEASNQINIFFLIAILSFRFLKPLFHLQGLEWCP